LQNELTDFWKRVNSFSQSGGAGRISPRSFANFRARICELSLARARIYNKEWRLDLFGGGSASARAFCHRFLSFVDNLKAIFGSLIDKEKTFFVFL